ncbi:MAG: prolyl oligopeptidase family serine peptidase [Actinomycetaceae bacterium]|nr:prolyl oligopeptidase family serine peptidase [Actinomycetaceae bacterium]
MTEQISREVLDEIDSPQALDWVRAHNERTLSKLQTPRYTTFNEQIKAVLDDPARIPFATLRDDWAFNFWVDENHPRGLWRRQLTTHYLAGDDDEWDILLDVDKLAEEEGKSWVYHGASVLYPEYTRALITLSDGGSDADVVREFDIATRTFIEDGFQLPESKGFCQWISEDEVLIGRDFGPGTMTKSGYPRQVRRWKRGQRIEDAEIIFEVPEDDTAVFAGVDHMPGWRRLIVERAKDFYSSETYVADPAAGSTLRKIPVPDYVEVGMWREWALMRPQKDWEYAGKSFKAGSLVVALLDDVLAQSADPYALFTPSDTTAMVDLTTTRHHVIINVLHNVSNRLGILTPPAIENGGWDRRDLQLSSDAEGWTVPEFASISVSAVNRKEEDRLWLRTTGFTTPMTLSLVELSRSGHMLSASVIRNAPTMFDAEGLEVSQHFATSEDGTRVPYFQISPADAEGPRPTLLYGYGGFEVSLTPAYLASAGRVWLEHGASYVIANIRGGGEYGPTWHRAALKENRHRAYEDFVAVADDLVARGVTTVEQLGAQGGSNGGLLMGMMLTKYPEHFGAIVCDVPLLDMQRFHTLLAGHSWIAEYGNPDIPEEWEFIKTFSPYHLFDPAREYPPVLFKTSTRDDRVHPAHARTMVAQMDEAGKDVLFYENVEGGHAGAADNAQRAKTSALAWEFLWQKLGGENAPAEG